MICSKEDPNLTERVTQRLQDRKGRMTGQRRLILETLETLPGHLTAEEIYLRVREVAPHLNLSTVYRMLRWLQKEGLISVRVFSEDERQDRFDPNLTTEHFHFVCLCCKQIIEFDEPSPASAIIADFERNNSARVENVGLVLHGLCRDCLSQEN